MSNLIICIRVLWSSVKTVLSKYQETARTAILHDPCIDFAKDKSGSLLLKRLEYGFHPSVTPVQKSSPHPLKVMLILPSDVLGADFVISKDTKPAGIAKRPADFTEAESSAKRPPASSSISESTVNKIESESSVLATAPSKPNADIKKVAEPSAVKSKDSNRTKHPTAVLKPKRAAPPRTNNK